MMPFRLRRERRRFHGATVATCGRILQSNSKAAALAGISETRIKLLVHDGFGVWCAARRLNESRFVWPREVPVGAAPMALTLALCCGCQGRMERGDTISVLNFGQV